MWRNSLKGARDPYFTSSRDGGKTFSPAQKLGLGSWPLKTCPMDGGSLVVGNDSQVFSVWRRGTSIYFAMPGAEERLLGKGKQPVITLDTNGPYTIWSFAESIYFLRPSDPKPVKLGKGSYPAIASTPKGKGPMIAAWESPEGIMVWKAEKSR